MSSGGGSTFENVKDWIEPFNGTGFELWKVSIRDYLRATGLHLPLSGEKPENMEDLEWERLDSNALNTIHLTLSSDIHLLTCDETTTAGIMAKLTDLYALKPTASTKVYLLHQLFNLKMKEGASAAEHLSMFSGITSKLSFINIKFEDDVRASMLLSTLPRSWSDLVISVTLSAGENKLSYNRVCGAILAEEYRREILVKSSINNSASSIDSRGRAVGRSSNRGR